MNRCPVCGWPHYTDAPCLPPPEEIHNIFVHFGGDDPVLADRQWILRKLAELEQAHQDGLQYAIIFKNVIRALRPFMDHAFENHTSWEPIAWQVVAAMRGIEDIDTELNPDE